MDSDETQMLEHPAQGAYLVKIGTMFGLFAVRCAAHTAIAPCRLPMAAAIAHLQRHNERYHSLGATRVLAAPTPARATTTTKGTQ